MPKPQVKAPESAATTNQQTQPKRWRTVKTPDGRTLQIAIVKKGKS
jgi:hypothetical protein